MPYICPTYVISRPSNLHNGIPYTGKMTCLYWIRLQTINFSPDIYVTSIWHMYVILEHIVRIIKRLHCRECTPAAILYPICRREISPTVTKMQKYPDSKLHGANMGPIWGRQEPNGPHVGPMNFAIWVVELFAFAPPCLLLFLSKSANLPPDNY